MKRPLLNRPLQRYSQRTRNVYVEYIGAMEASYGGYFVFYLAGTHKGRFKAFLAHCGIFNMEFMYSTTEEMFFEEWEQGGAPYDRDRKSVV